MPPSKVQNKFCIKATGMILTLVNIIFFIIIVFLCGFSYHQTYQPWTSHGGYYLIGVFQLTSILFELVAIVLGFLLFSQCSENKQWNIIVSYLTTSNHLLHSSSLLMVYQCYSQCQSLYSV